MSNARHVMVLVLALVVSLVPAVVHALRGIEVADRSYTDCKGTGGLMRTELLDYGSPYDWLVDLDELKDSSNKVHAAYGTFADTIDATEYGRMRSWLSTFKGIREGNASGNNRKAETAPPGNPNIRDDNGFLEVRATCQDCDYGQWEVTLKQRVWQKIRISWLPNFHNQAPEWSVSALSIDINGHINLLRTDGEFDAANGTATTQVLCKTVIPPPPGSPPGTSPTDVTHGVTVVDQVASETTEDADGDWASDPWSPNNDHIMEFVGFWDVYKDKTYKCNESSSFPQDELYVLFATRLSTEDKSDPQYSFDESSSCLLQGTPEYGTLVLLWNINVNLNCDATNEQCSCWKYSNPSTDTPETP